MADHARFDKKRSRWKDRQERRVERIVEAMDHFDDKVLTHLAHCAEIDRGAGPTPAAGNDRSSVGTHSDPTLMAVMNRVCAFKVDDKVCGLLEADHERIDHHFVERSYRIDGWLHELNDAMREAERAVVDAVGLRDNILNRAHELDRANPKAGAGYCGACGCWVTGGADDRIRAGYCRACYKAWNRAGRPDRMRFEAERRKRADREREAHEQHRVAS